MKHFQLISDLALSGSLLFNITLSIIAGDVTELIAWVLASLLFWRVHQLEKNKNSMIT
jgi:hypothetical protein